MEGAVGKRSAAEYSGSYSMNSDVIEKKLYGIQLLEVKNDYIIGDRIISGIAFDFGEDLQIGDVEEYALGVGVYISHKDYLMDPYVKWNVSDPLVSDFHVESGVIEVHAKKCGKATITVTLKSGSCNIYLDVEVVSMLEIR